jgi:hypothetical protein
VCGDLPSTARNEALPYHYIHNLEVISENEPLEADLESFPYILTLSSTGHTSKPGERLGMSHLSPVIL